MNIQKLYKALELDEKNSALGIIVIELEKQGYKVQIDGNSVDSKDMFESNYSKLEGKIGPLAITLFKGNSMEQEFTLEFVEFHDFIIRRKEYE